MRDERPPGDRALRIVGGAAHTPRSVQTLAARQRVAAAVGGRGRWPGPGVLCRNVRRARSSGHRDPVAVIDHAVWLHLRFPPGLRIVEKMLAESGILAIHETIRGLSNGGG